MILRSRLICGLIVLLAFFIPCGSLAQQAAQSSPISGPIHVPAEAEPSPHFNAERAAEAYLAEIPSDAKVRSDAYFEGGYWMMLWDFLYGVVIALVLPNLRWSAEMRTVSERITRFKPLQTMIYWTQYLVITTIMVFPLTVYEDYFREHKYGLANQTFSPWMVDQLKNLGVNLVLGAILTVLLFGIVRRLRQTWWIWGSGVTLLFLMFASLITPVYLMPIFNTVTPLDDPKITQPILAMARGEWDSCA